jgi:cytochrome c biogenesis protein CcmG, thiol:disulfide interchange protein DsbE
MKKIFFLTVSMMILGIAQTFGQDEVRVLPDIKVKSLDGKWVQTGEFKNDGKPIIISFWATWCKPCVQELMAVSEEYDDLVAETGAKLIAISIDDARNASKVAPFVQGKDWSYDVYIDENSDFKRAMSVNNVPHTFLLNGKGEIVWNHNSYSPGDEEELFELVRKLAKGEDIKATEKE